jgi:hypothetical protein
VLAVRNPAHADSLEFALNDGFDRVAVTAAGASVRAERRERSVVVYLEPAREHETLCFELAGRPGRSLDEQRAVLTPESVFLLWSDAFYPLDYQAWAAVRLRIALPAGFRILAPGHEIGRPAPAPGAATAGQPETSTTRAPGGAPGTAGSGGAAVVWHTYVSDQPVRLFSVLADRRWIETRRRSRGLTLRTLLYPAAQPYADSLLARSADVLAFYTRTYGPYPFDEFTFATLDSLYARRALAGGVVYSPAYLEREMQRTGYDGHETALLWWFHATAGSGPGSFQWTEGLGDYAEYLYDEARGKPLPENWQRFRTQYLALPAGREPPIMQLRGSTPQAVVHGKYPWLMHLLRFAVGDDAFLRSQRALFDRFRYRTFTLDQLVAVLQEATGQPLDWWRDDWLLRPAVPELSLSWSARPAGTERSGSAAPATSPAARPAHAATPTGQAGGYTGEAAAAPAAGWLVDVRLQQSTPPFRFPLEIALFLPSGTRTERVWVDDVTYQLSLHLPERPDSVVADPHGWLLLHRR